MRHLNKGNLLTFLWWSHWADSQDKRQRTIKCYLNMPPKETLQKMDSFFQKPDRCWILFYCFTPSTVKTEARHTETTSSGCWFKLTKCPFSSHLLPLTCEWKCQRAGYSAPHVLWELPLLNTLTRKGTGEMFAYLDDLLFVFGCWAPASKKGEKGIFLIFKRISLLMKLF